MRLSRVAGAAAVVVGAGADTTAIPRGLVVVGTDTILAVHPELVADVAVCVGRCLQRGVDPLSWLFHLGGTSWCMQYTHTQQATACRRGLNTCCDCCAEQLDWALTDKHERPDSKKAARPLQVS